MRNYVYSNKELNSELLKAAQAIDACSRAIAKGDMLSAAIAMSEALTGMHQTAQLLYLERGYRFALMEADNDSNSRR